MTEREFITWLRGHMMEANYANTFNWEILDKLLLIKSEIPSSKQLEIPFPESDLSKTIWVSDSTSGKHTYSTLTYREDNGTIY
jgi:hypothetical protein